VLELERVVPLALEVPHQLLRHPLDLRLGELHHVVAHVVAQRQRVGQQPGLGVLPQLSKQTKVKAFWKNSYKINFGYFSNISKKTMF
jgi:hypothetical protein